MYTPSRSVWLLVSAIGVALVAAVWLLPPLFVGESETAAEARRHKSINDVRVALLQALAGTFLAGGLYFTARTFSLSRQGQLGERLGDAIDQLGNHESVAARIGGVYVLERLAQLSPELARSIVPLLDAFVHERAPWPPRKGQPARVPADVEAAVKVLTRVAPLITKPVFGPVRPRLDKLDLRQGDFDLANFDGASLRGTNFDGASLVLAKFKGAWLQGASFMDVDLEHVNLDGAYYSERSTRFSPEFAPDTAGLIRVPDREDLLELEREQAEAERDWNALKERLDEDDTRSRKPPGPEP